MIKYQQSLCLTSHFESFWSIVQLKLEMIVIVRSGLLVLLQVKQPLQLVTPTLMPSQKLILSAVWIM